MARLRWLQKRRLRQLIRFRLSGKAVYVDTSLIGVLVAFISVMFILSLVVTGLVQLTQALLRLRGRNLLVGISALLTSEKEKTAPATTSDSRTGESREPEKTEAATASHSRRGLSRRQNAALAAEILNKTMAAQLRPVDYPNSFVNVLI